MSDNSDDETLLYVGNRPMSAHDARTANLDMDDEDILRELRSRRANTDVEDGVSGVDKAIVDQRAAHVAAKGSAALAQAESQMKDRRGVVPRDGVSSKPGSAAGQSRRTVTSRGGDRSDVARIIALEEEVRALQNTVRNQEKGLTQMNLESEKQRKIIVGLTAKLDKESAENKSLRNELKIQETMAATYKKEAAMSQKTQAKGAPAADSDVRLKRALEELEACKAQLAKEPAVPASDAKHREQVADLNGKLNDLLNVVRRQNKMIDILKRQKMHLEAAKLLQFTEQEFTKVLEINEA